MFRCGRVQWWRNGLLVFLLFILFRSNTSSTDPLVESSSLVDTTNTEHLTKANETIATTQSIIDLSQTQQDSTHHDSTDTVLPSNTNEQLVGTNNELIGDSVKESADSNEGAGSNQEDSAHNTSEPEDPQQGVDQSEGEMTHSIDTEEGTSIHSIHNTDSIDEVDGDGRGSVGVAQEEEGDDIVTFEEFKSKMNQEVVINKPPQGGSPVPLRQSYHNYALSECGAKVLESNKEAKNAGSILLENKDLYMLNPCSANIWFVIELCELVSVSILEIGCFELFSSIPETIAVYTSDSYPNPTWEKLGIFSLNDDRSSQKFPLEESVYTKHIKFEMLSHFGAEHYCPISTVKVLGTTMIEEYEYTESQRDGGKNGGHIRSNDASETIIQSEDGDERTDSTMKGNPIKVATDAILSVIGKAVNGLMSPDDNTDDFLEDSLDVLQPSLFESSKSNDSPNYSKAFQEHSQQNQQDQTLGLDTPSTDKFSDSIEPTQTIPLQDSDVTLNCIEPSTSTLSNDQLGPIEQSSISSTESVFTSIESDQQVVQTESKSVSQASTESMIASFSTTSSQVIIDTGTFTVSSASDNSIGSSLEVKETNEMDGKLVSPDQSILKPVNPNDSETTPPQYSQNVQSISPIGNDLSPDNGMASDDNATDNDTRNDNASTSQDMLPNSSLIDTNVTQDKVSEANTILDFQNSSTTNCTSHSNATVNVVNDTNSSEESESNGNGSGHGSIAGSREKSVFVRLSNRINTLETNMTLFDSYLDQISQSLKKNKNRTEDMQRTLERRMGVLNDSVQLIKDQIYMNVSVFSKALSSLDDLKQVFLFQYQEWTFFTDFVFVILLVIVFLQSLGILLCYFLYRSQSIKTNTLENTLQRIETQMNALSGHLLSSQKQSTTRLRNHPNGAQMVNGTLESHKKANPPVAVVGSFHDLLSSASSPNLSSMSSSTAMLYQDDSRDSTDQKWRKVESKRHKKSSCKKAEQ